MQGLSVVSSHECSLQLNCGSAFLVTTNRNSIKLSAETCPKSDTILFGVQYKQKMILKKVVKSGKAWVKVT